MNDPQAKIIIINEQSEIRTKSAKKPLARWNIRESERVRVSYTYFVDDI